jgi:hypothetical protein
MRHLRLYENSSRYDLLKNKNWSKFTTDLFDQYCDKFKPTIDFVNAYIISIFDDIDEEYDTTTGTELYFVYEDVGDKEVTYAVCDAIGEYHALIKASIHLSNENILLYGGSYITSDKEIDEKLEYISNEYERTKKVLETII